MCVWISDSLTKITYNAGPKGFVESGGSPYRLVFPPDLVKTAQLQSLVGDLATPMKNAKFVYGQTFK